MHDKLFDSRPTTPDEAFILVDSLNIDRDRFETCIAGPTPEEIISRDLSLASSLGLTATPSFAVGTVASDNQVTIKTFIRGAQPFAVFEEAIAGL
jgi:protein-disulfide isomerase